jgi:hypothetical protein
MLPQFVRRQYQTLNGQTARLKGRHSQVVAHALNSMLTYLVRSHRQSALSCGHNAFDITLQNHTDAVGN